MLGVLRFLGAEDFAARAAGLPPWALGVACQRWSVRRETAKASRVAPGRACRKSAGFPVVVGHLWGSSAKDAPKRLPGKSPGCGSRCVALAWLSSWLTGVPKVSELMHNFSGGSSSYGIYLGQTHITLRAHPGDTTGTLRIEKWQLPTKRRFRTHKSKKPAKPSAVLVSEEFCGAAGRIRTGDLLITNQLLYRLSYSSARRIIDELPVSEWLSPPYDVEHGGKKDGRWRDTEERSGNGWWRVCCCRRAPSLSRHRRKLAFRCRHWRNGERRCRPCPPEPKSEDEAKSLWRSHIAGKEKVVDRHVAETPSTGSSPSRRKSGRWRKRSSGSPTSFAPSSAMPRTSATWAGGSQPGRPTRTACGRIGAPLQPSYRRLRSW